MQADAARQFTDEVLVLVLLSNKPSVGQTTGLDFDGIHGCVDANFPDGKCEAPQPSLGSSKHLASKGGQVGDWNGRQEGHSLTCPYPNSFTYNSSNTVA